jgi:mono/diheme cytochrome c family protein
MKFLLGLLIGLLLWPTMGYLYFRFGYAPVATAAPPMPFEKQLARMALHARMAAEAPTSAPIQPDPTTLAAGAKIYVDDCAFCHGLPHQQDVPPAGKGMFPVPPQLFNPDEMVTADPVGETYWKVAHGIRLTGMPAFTKSLSTDQMWQVSLLLAHADKLPEPVKAALQPGAHTTIPPASTQ